MKVFSILNHKWKAHYIDIYNHVVTILFIITKLISLNTTQCH